MTRKTVFLTGAGGAAIPGLVKHLQRQGYRVLCGDMDVHAIGLYVADKGFILPKGESPDFLPALKKICKEEQVDAVIPLVDEELISAVELESEGIPVVVPRKAFIERCLDKYALMKQLTIAGIPSPRTKLLEEGYEDLVFPLIAKPRTGRGSRGVQRLENEEEFREYAKKVSPKDRILIQEYTEGTEFTVSVMVWRDGSVQAIVPKEIIVKDQITKVAVTRHHAGIHDCCMEVQKQLQADGPFNVQLMLDHTGIPYIFEINPRFSTSISLTMACGIDELGDILYQAIHGVEAKQLLEWKEGIVLLRQTFDEFVFEESFLKRYKQMRNQVKKDR